MSFEEKNIYQKAGWPGTRNYTVKKNHSNKKNGAKFKSSAISSLNQQLKDTSSHVTIKNLIFLIQFNRKERK